jgi:hypothetical protein
MRTGEQMGAALFVVAEKKMPEVDTFVNGKALACCNHLDKLAKKAGIKPLMEFFSISPEDAKLQMEDFGIDFDPEGLPPTDWFDAKEGLMTVRGLLAYLKANPKAIKNPDGVVEDLKEFEDVLTKLDQGGVRWHLAVDV